LRGRPPDGKNPHATPLPRHNGFGNRTESTMNRLNATTGTHHQWGAGMHSRGGYPLPARARPILDPRKRRINQLPARQSSSFNRSRIKSLKGGAFPADVNPEGSGLIKDVRAIKFRSREEVDFGHSKKTPTEERNLVQIGNRWKYRPNYYIEKRPCWKDIESPQCGPPWQTAGPGRCP